MTVRFDPSNRTRAPLELGCSPSPASITPALTSSSLNLPMSSRTFSCGRTPDSDSLLALTMTMNRMFVLPVRVGSRAREPNRFVSSPASIWTSNDIPGDRHAAPSFFDARKSSESLDLFPELLVAFDGDERRDGHGAVLGGDPGGRAH